jgi:hypothetical protein
LRQTRPVSSRPATAWLFTLAAVVAVSALVLSLARRWEDRRHLATGRAQWIWLTYDLKKPAPLRFFAAKEFDWNRAPEGPARLLLFVDRRYVLFVNGSRVGAGEQKPGDPLHVYEVSQLLRPGRNRIAIEAESPDGAGGILFALALPGGRMVVSDGSWRVGRSEKELAGGGAAAVIWGRPPMYPWRYPLLPRRS